MNLDTSYTRGLAAEIWALGYLLLKGYRILAWRYKTPVGEVDIIAAKNKTLIFVEVKQRPDLDIAALAVTARMRSRIARAAGHFLAGQRGASWDITRFDVIAIAKGRIRHLDNAWVAPS